MKKALFIIIFILVGLSLNGTMLATLDELSKPNMLSVEGNNILITEGTSIYIYSLSDYKLVSKFGKDGEGPKEFKVSRFGPPLIAYFLDDKLCVSSNGKLSFFTLKGEFISEMRIPPFAVAVPFLNKFIATGSATMDNKKTVLCVNLYDSKMKKLKLLYKSDMEVGPNASFSYPITSFSYQPYQNYLYLVRGTSGFVIDVYDQNGKVIRTIKKEEPRISVDKLFRDKTVESFKTNPNFKQFWEFFKTRIKFKEYYPPIQGIRVADDLIYVFTYKTKGNGTECIILDLNGKEIKRLFLPLPRLYGMDYMPKFDFNNRQFYYLKENDDDEVWELYSIKLIEGKGSRLK